MLGERGGRGPDLLLQNPSMRPTNRPFLIGSWSSPGVSPSSPIGLLGSVPEKLISPTSWEWGIGSSIGAKSTFYPSPQASLPRGLPSIPFHFPTAFPTFLKPPRQLNSVYWCQCPWVTMIPHAGSLPPSLAQTCLVAHLPQHWADTRDICWPNTSSGLHPKTVV